MKELLNTTISRRDAVTTTAKLGAAVALSNAITLPFSTTVRAETSDTGKTNENAETVRHSACLVNCGSRCPLKVIVKDGRIVRIEAEDAKDVNIRFDLAYVVVPAAGVFIAPTVLNIP